MRYLIPLLLGLLATSATAEPLTYDGALALAERSAPGLQARALQVEASRAAARAAGALPDPKLRLGLENFPVSGPPAGRFDAEAMTMARIGVMQEIPNAGRRAAARAEAQAEIGLARAETDVLAREVRVGAAVAWMDLAYAEKRLGTLDQLTAGLAGLWEGQPAAVASGAARPAAGLEPVRLQALFEDMRSDLVAEAARARAELVRWTGASDPAVAGSPPGIEVRPARLRAGLESLPALAAREAVTRRAQAAADAARAARRPDWAVEVAYGRRDPMFGDMVSAGVTVSLPLFAARRQDPIIAARNAEAARTRLEREATRRALSAALEADLATYAARREQWRRAVEVLVPAAEQRADLEVRSYAAGRATYDDVTAALTALAETRLEALAREAAVLREGARITLTYGPDQ